MKKLLTKLILPIFIFGITTAAQGVECGSVSKVVDMGSFVFVNFPEDWPSFRSTFLSKLTSQNALDTNGNKVTIWTFPPSFEVGTKNFFFVSLICSISTPWTFYFAGANRTIKLAGYDQPFPSTTLKVASGGATSNIRIEITVDVDHVDNPIVYHIDPKKDYPSLRFFDPPMSCPEQKGIDVKLITCCVPGALGCNVT